MQRSWIHRAVVAASLVGSACAPDASTRVAVVDVASLSGPLAEARGVEAAALPGRPTFIVGACVLRGDDVGAEVVLRTADGPFAVVRGSSRAKAGLREDGSAALEVTAWPLRLTGRVARGELPVFAARDTTFADVLVATPEAPLRVESVTASGVRASMTTPRALVGIPSVVAKTVPCEALKLGVGVVAETIPRETAELATAVPVPLASASDGPAVATLVRDADEESVVTVVARHAGRAKVLWQASPGTRVTGWVNESSLLAHGPRAVASEPADAGDAAEGRSREAGMTCRRELPLVVDTREGRARVGAVTPGGVIHAVRELPGGWTVITVDSAYVRTTTRARWLVRAADLAGCQVRAR